MRPANALGEVKTLGPAALAALVMPQELCPTLSLAGHRTSWHGAELHLGSSGPPGTEDCPTVPPDGQMDRTDSPSARLHPVGRKVAPGAPLLAGGKKWAPAPSPGVLQCTQMEVSQSFKFSVIPQEGDSGGRSLNLPFSALKTSFPAPCPQNRSILREPWRESWARQSCLVFFGLVQAMGQICIGTAPAKQPHLIWSLKFKHLTS